MLQEIINQYLLLRQIVNNSYLLSLFFFFFVYQKLVSQYWLLMDLKKEKSELDKNGKYKNAVSILKKFI